MLLQKNKIKCSDYSSCINKNYKSSDMTEDIIKKYNTGVKKCIKDNQKQGNKNKKIIICISFLKPKKTHKNYQCFSSWSSPHGRESQHQQQQNCCAHGGHFSALFVSPPDSFPSPCVYMYSRSDPYLPKHTPDKSLSSKYNFFKSPNTSSTNVFNT